MSTLRTLFVGFVFGICANPTVGQQARDIPSTKEPSLDGSREPGEPDKDRDQKTTDENSPNAEPKQDEKAAGQQADKSDTEDESGNPARKKSKRNGNRVYSKRSEDFASVFSPIVASTSNTVVRITNSGKQVALGLVVDSDGLILTKASELKGELKCKLADGTILKPTIVGIDPETDLVLLKVKKQGFAAARMDEDFLPKIGAWLATVDQQEKPLAVGIVSHEAREIKNNVANSAIIGIRPEDRLEGDGVRINFVFNDSPASTAGLQVNDVIIGIDEDEVLNRNQLLEKLSQFQPGDEIVLKIRRGADINDVPVTLGKRKTNPMMNRGNRQNRMGSTLSRRRSDFPLAIQHDSAINANQCGGPVVDLSGRIVGINIARDGRVSSLVLPNEVLLPVIAKLKTGKWTPEFVNKKEIDRVEKELAQLEVDLGSLPQEKTRKELEFSAGAAVEDELKRQVKETKERLDKLQARFDEKKKTNRVIGDSIADIRNKQNRIERKREPLQQDLKQLKTGVR